MRPPIEVESSVSLPGRFGAWSRQAASLAGAVVPESERGALVLGDAYWRCVRRATRGLVHPLHGPGGALSLRVLGRGPDLLRLAPPRVQVAPGRVGCRYAIAGGLLARRPGGVLVLEQVSDGGVVISADLRGFRPRLGARRVLPLVTGVLYDRFQRPFHVAVSSRYLREIAREAAR